VPQTLESRVEELERRVEALAQANTGGRPRNPWRTYGAFKDDPQFEEAVRLGRDYRQQQTVEKELAGS